MGASVGTSADTDDRVSALIEAGVDVLVVDTAHGHSKRVLDRISWIKQKYSRTCPLIGGNVATAGRRARARRCRRRFGESRHRSRQHLHYPNRHRHRCAAGDGGIGSCRRARSDGIPVIADGGIRYSGDIAKALVAGASV